MKKIVKAIFIVVAVLIMILPLVGCGGGGGGGDNPTPQANNDPGTNDPPPSDNSPPSDNPPSAPPPANQPPTDNPPPTAGTGIIQLPKTGQTISYAPGDDGDLQKGVAWPNPRFVDNADGTVTDNLTGLMWTKDASYFKTAFPSLTTLPYWRMVVQFAGQFGPASYKGWRIPNMYELESLTDASRTNPPTMNARGAVE